MAAKEDLYAKVAPRMQRQNRPGTVKHGNSLDVLLSMGFPKTRALFSHVDDPFLDDPLPREYVLYLKPSGPLLNQLSNFWQQSRITCGKNKAHNIFPHITLCQFFMCADGKVDALCEALQAVVGQWKGRFPSPLPLEFYSSSNFIGLFVEEKVAETLRVMYPYVPQNDDELELVPSDFIFMSSIEQATASEGWVYGTSMSTGLSGLLPENYVNRADECDTWVYHGSFSFLNGTPPASIRGAMGGIFLDPQHMDGRLLDDPMPLDPPNLSVICQPMQILRPNQSRLPKRTLFVCRHGERMDVVFGKHWITQCFDAKGRYVRSNLNMPQSLPARSGGYRDYDKDCPITVFGSTQARLVGEALLESHTVVDFVYCSPSLRCVQTAYNILKGLQKDGKTKIRVEPGLFEWTKWVSGTSLPAWIPPADLAAANLCVDTTYRPHIPVSKLAVSESYETYISRSFQVTREILSECNNLGNTVLIVAHASSLEACTRQIQGLTPQNSKDFVQVVRKIPYLGFCACEEMGDTGVWQLVDPPILPLTHGPNHSFNWRETLLQD
ncbi:ubiquitin-associated and SH3 domain-containing B-like protein [Labeo rohita]|uniref:Ubiquitin-associated and SH3 domain-containing B-like protein n=1 Tax=Labeo rohita TaxID=84645 RepID=A0A498LPR5_LABRO|nr:ubiquitin-associated and SH3 domain-containing B-like protein [Labeo rohita]